MQHTANYGTPRFAAAYSRLRRIHTVCAVTQEREFGSCKWATHNPQPTPRNTQRRTRRLCCALSLLSSLSSLPCHRFFDRLRWWLWWLSSLPRSLSWWWLRLCCRCITDHNIRSKTTHAKRCQADSLRVRKQVRGMRKTELKRR